MQTLVHAIYHDEKRAAKAVEALIESDFDPSEICVLMKAGEQVTEMPVRQKTGVGRGAAIGAALGAVGGAVVAPGLGLLAAGPLLAALEGLLAGGAAGTITGALAGLGYWKDEAKLPHKHIEGGSILVGAMVLGDQGRATVTEALQATGGEHIHASTRQEAYEEVRQR